MVAIIDVIHCYKFIMCFVNDIPLQVDMAYMSNTAWDADFRDDCKHFAYKELSGSRNDHVHDDKENMVTDLSDLTDEVHFPAICLVAWWCSGYGVGLVINRLRV